MAAPAVTGLNSDQNNLTTALIATVLAKLARKRSRSPDEHDTPVKKCAHPMPLSSPITSPPPKHDEVLHTCLLDLASQQGIDLLLAESFLQAEDYTPDIIPFVDDTVLISGLGISSGKVMKFKWFCKEWYQRYEKKTGARKSVFS